MKEVRINPNIVRMLGGKREVVSYSYAERTIEYVWKPIQLVDVNNEGKIVYGFYAGELYIDVLKAERRRELELIELEGKMSASVLHQMEVVAKAYVGAVCRTGRSMYSYEIDGMEDIGNRGGLVGEDVEYGKAKDGGRGKGERLEDETIDKSKSVEYGTTNFSVAEFLRDKEGNQVPNLTIEEYKELCIQEVSFIDDNLPTFYKFIGKVSRVRKLALLYTMSVMHYTLNRETTLKRIQELIDKRELVRTPCNNDKV